MESVLRKMAECQRSNLQFTIAALGDSVTDGCFIPDEKDFDAVYHARLAKKLRCVFPALRINMINSGIGGINTPNSVLRLDRDIFSYNPDLVIVCLGLNDICGDRAVYLSSLGKIISEIKSRGIDVIFMTPNMVDTYCFEERLRAINMYDKYADYLTKLAGKQTSGEIDEMFEAAKKTALDLGAAVCDCYSAWRRLYDCGVDTTKLLANAINHPTKEMHELFASMLFCTILA